MINNNNKKVMILGSKGFLGSVLMNELKYNTIGIHREICDLTDLNKTYKFIKDISPDVVILCATAGGKEKLGEFNQQELYNNLKIFQNISNLNNYYKLLINVGSGAEMDITTDITNVSEDEIDLRLPRDSYGLAKNIISRYCRLIPNSITLRIFGCFHHSEPDFRLLKKYCSFIKNNKKFIIPADKYFSWISASDFCNIVSDIIENWVEYPMDINCAYNEQLLLSEFLERFCVINSLPINFKILQKNNLSYTCNTKILYSSISNLNIDMDTSMKKYFT